MKNIILSFLLLTACETNKYSPAEKPTKTYEIICKHPLGHIERHKVSQEEFDIPTNFRGGIWSFKAIEGYKIRSTYCHSDSRSMQKGN